MAGSGSHLGAAMLITRTPLRISLGGGGTDLPSYYRRFGGLVISAAINRYVYIGINRTFTDDYFLKYSELERVNSVTEIRHPIMREALTMHPVGPAVEIVSLADIPGGNTGLLVRDYKGRNADQPVYKADPALMAELRAHERQAANGWSGTRSITTV